MSPPTGGVTAREADDVFAAHVVVETCVHIPLVCRNSVASTAVSGPTGVRATFADWPTSRRFNGIYRALVELVKASGGLFVVRLPVPVAGLKFSVSPFACGPSTIWVLMK